MYQAVSISVQLCRCYTSAIVHTWQLVQTSRQKDGNPKITLPTTHVMWDVLY